ncbi:phage portal protein [Nonomuraea candida]|uniref:phage portal protein n=1 Tax=Nonomuraea candida TaxID=359159 RepID=UPI0005BCBCC3|nr:phage portal protein [Nonomuraea candida]
MARRFLPGLRATETTAQPIPQLSPAERRELVETELKALVPATGTVAVSDWSSHLSAAARRAWPVDRAVAEAFERTVWVFKSVDSIAEHQSDLDFVERHRKSGELVEDDPLLELLNDGQANELETGRQFRYRLSAQVLLSARGAFVEITKDRGGRPIRLDLLPPGRTRPVPGLRGKLLSHFETITPDGIRIPIPPDRVRWFRKPHPTDPYMGITPLQAAGLAVDQDFLAKIYNSSFMLNDGRPAGILSVEGRSNPADAAKLEQRFGHGPVEAGKLTVIGGGKLSYVDLGATPRDMAYGEMAARAKEEVLAAYGVGETVLGNSSGRTWDNAEQELFTFWTITMKGHLRIVTTGFGPDMAKGVRAEFDTSTVEVLRRTAEARRREAREEVKEGLISPDEYREIAEYEPYGLPHTRAIYVAQGKTPIPTRPEDAEALGLAAPDASAAPPAAPGGELPPGEELPAGQAAPEGGQVDPDDPATGQAMAMLQGMLDEDADALDDQDEDGEDQDGEEEGRQRRGRRPETKALPEPAPPADDVRDRIEQDLRAALQQLVRRLVQRTAARVASPKIRKHTRHFVPEYEQDTRVGAGPLDAERVADVEQWREEAAAVLTPVLVASAAAVAGPDAAASVGAASPPISEAREWLVAEVVGAARLLGALIRTLDAGGADIDRLVSEVRAQLPGLERWAARAGVQAATGLTHAVEYVVITDAVGAAGMVSAMWRTRGDDDVRLSHRDAEGQVRRAGVPFDVGDARLRWPGDFAAPMEETAYCRCRLRWIVSPA